MKHQSSGQNEDDVMKAAHEIFFNDYQAKFTMEHCWRELRHDQKWKSVFKSRDGAKEKRKEAEEVIHGDEVRPPGVKASKAAKRKRHRNEAAYDRLQSILDLKQNISKQKLLDRLLSKKETLTESEVSLKDKLVVQVAMSRVAMSVAGSLVAMSGSRVAMSVAGCTMFRH
ncbi:PREDICTED: glutathione S-transferase T2-like [Brassica oleracea var. oleracea]|uniref:glutathione S-transferase T2-like n=1 Tax=Brassica oleracea var. oleracea TaxID=109376 RepID=UPI0006A6DD99|nr:PREDICTED: glutathione S-transferase T2-like [Brassica oleracea var. oleracea]